MALNYFAIIYNLNHLGGVLRSYTDKYDILRSCAVLHSFLPIGWLFPPFIQNSWILCGVLLLEDANRCGHWRSNPYTIQVFT